MKKKHKSRNNNDRGAVLSLDDVKRHVSSRLFLSTSTSSDSVSLAKEDSSRLSFCLISLCAKGDGRRSKCERKETDMKKALKKG